MKRLNKYLAAALALLMNTGCSGKNFDLKDMESAEKEWNERARHELLAFMSLETMFPDEKVRALAEAAGKGKVKKVEELVRSGVDVDARGTQGATPLFWAMKNYKGFKKLLELGADPNVVYGDGGTIMHWAVEATDGRILQAALSHGGNPNIVKPGEVAEIPVRKTPIFEALKHGPDRIDILLDAGAKIDARDGFGNTPVMMAASRPRFEVVLHLLERGADYTIANNAGETLTTKIADKIGRLDPKHEEAKWLQRVIDWLEAHGVRIDA